MEQPKIHYPAVLVAAVIQFVLGWGWYTLLSSTWMEATGVTTEMMQQLSGGEIAVMYFGSLVAYLAVYYVMAHTVEYTKSTTAKQGAQTGFWSWLGFVGPVLYVINSYNFKPFSLWLIDGGYWLASMVIGGILLAVWKKKESAPSA